MTTDIQNLTARLRDTPNWQRESYGDWKNGTLFYDRAPFEAADALEALQAEVAKVNRNADKHLSNLVGLIKERDAALARLRQLEKSINYTGDAIVVKQSGLPFKPCSCVARADDDVHKDGCEFWLMVQTARNMWHDKHVAAWSCAMESKGNKCCNRWCGTQETCTAAIKAKEI